MSEYEYGRVTQEIIDRLNEITPRRVYTGDEINDDFTHDEMSIYGKAKPEAVVEPLTTEEAAAVMKLCNEHKIPVTPSGARTGLVGGAVSIHGGIILSITKMNKILGYDIENFVVTIQPGVLLNDLAEDAEKQGLLYPPAADFDMKKQFDLILIRLYHRRHALDPFFQIFSAGI